MPNCRVELSGLELSADKAERRIRRAMDVLGEKVVVRLLAFAVFLPGAERKSIASLLAVPLGTLLSLPTRVGRTGLAAFEDRRRSHTEFRPAVEAAAPAPTVAMEDGHIVIGSDRSGHLRIPARDAFQVRVILLSLVNGGALAPRAAAEMLGCTAAHVRTLCRKLEVDGSYDFCPVVAELSGVECPPEKELGGPEKRREWLGREDKRIVIHFTPFHGSWLNLVEIWFRIMGRMCLRDSYDGPEQLCETILQYAATWSEQWAHPFNWDYDGTGLHRKAVLRFIGMLRGILPTR